MKLNCFGPRENNIFYTDLQCKIFLGLQIDNIRGRPNREGRQRYQGWKWGYPNQHGFTYQAEAVHRCLAAGMLECPQFTQAKLDEGHIVISMPPCQICIDNH